MSETVRSFESVTVNCNGAKKFLQELDETNERWGDHEWIYRGQNDASWKLMPSLYRDESRAEIAFREIRLIASFVRKANNVDLPLPANATGYFHYYNEPKSITQTGVDDPYGDRLLYDFRDAAFAIAQHSGVPTRLLDFTHDPYVAAYFAAETTGLGRKLRCSDEYRAKYFDDILDKFQQRHDPCSILVEYWERWKEIIAKLPKELVVWAVQVDAMQLMTSLRLLDHPYTEILNLRAQKGTFVCDTDRYDLEGQPWRAFDEELAKLVESKGVFKVTLPFSKLEDLRVLLTKKGYFPAKLTPSYDLTGREAVINAE